MERWHRRFGPAVLVAAVLLCGPARAGTTTLEVTLDRAKLIRLPEKAQTIVVGNPVIADVTPLKNDSLVVITGKGYGTTNMIFLDKAGQAIEEADVRVVAGTAQVTVQRGLARETYSCEPRCQPMIALGDDDGFIKGASGQVQSRNQLAVPGSH